jgi:hypothetical protein
MNYEAKLKELQDQLETIKGQDAPYQSTAVMDFGNRDNQTGEFI